MNKPNPSRGFTLIEMMVALAVGGMLMATLVGLSGTVQRSFGRSKEITDLQNDLRYALKILGEDLGRAGFMHSANPSIDFMNVKVVSGSVDQAELQDFPAVRWNPPFLELNGNYISARDYLWKRSTNEICCRNKVEPSKPEFLSCDRPGQFYERYLLPFADGPAEVDYVFCPGLLARIQIEDGKFTYQRVAGVSDVNTTVTFDVNPDAVEDDYLWINPVNQVQYELAADPGYVSPHATPTPAASRWQLFRRITGCRDGVLTAAEDLFLAEYLLPSAGPRPGLELSSFEDLNAVMGAPVAAVNISVPPNRIYPDSGYVFQPHQMRGVVVTLRGRGHTEDPEFTITDYAGDEAAAMRFGVDLDNEPKNGLAHVREMSTVIEIANLGLGPT